MKILRFLLYIVLAIAAIVILAGLFARKDYHVEASAEIDAPKSLIIDQVSHFANFPKWSPWQELDPNMKTSIAGEDGKVGAVYSWTGNDKAGTGSMTTTAITDSQVDQRVDFTEPWASSSPTSIICTEANGKTNVKWTMDIKAPFPMNGLMMFMDVQKAVGKDYERGLAKLKKHCEALAHPTYDGYEVKEENLATRYYAAIRQVVPFTKMVAFFGKNMAEIIPNVMQQGAKPVMPLSGLFWSYDETKLSSDCAAAVQIETQQKLGKGVGVWTMNAGKAAVIDYYGDYALTGKAHLAMDKYLAAKNLKSLTPVIEEYMTDTTKEPDTAKWLTRVIYYLN